MSPRLAAANALATVMAGKASLGTSLPAQLQHVSERDHALTQELAFGTARWFQRLDGLASALLEKPLKAADRALHALPTGRPVPAFIYPHTGPRGHR